MPFAFLILVVEAAVPTGRVAAPAIDLAAIDRKVIPGDDFDAFSNGRWQEAAQIPADKSVMSPFQDLTDLTRERIATLIKDSATRASGDQVASKIGEFYSTFMNEKAIEAAGLMGLTPSLERIDAIADKKELAKELGATVRADVDALNSTNFQTSNLFGLWVVQALDDPQHYAPYLLQGGLSMPDREYYTSEDKKMAELRAQYRAHVFAMLKLAGIAKADLLTDGIVGLETKIAQAHATRAESNDVKAVAVWKRDDFPKNAPGLDWEAFFEGASLSKPPRFFVWHPAPTRGIAALVGGEPLEVWKAWLTFHAIDGAAPFLPRAFVNQRFEFYGKALSGTRTLRERWKLGVDFTDLALGDAIGQLYVKKYFSPEAKAKLELMVAQLLKAFAARIDRLEWMSAATKAKAKEKVSTLVVGVGYPDTFRDYGGLQIVRGDAVGNSLRAKLHDYRYAVAKLDRPVDRHEWWMTPQTVNAVNLPLQNAMNFPAGMLQAPFFDLSFDSAVNYGSIGSVIGHEISHSFDDSGSQFDAHGVLTNWWSPDDLAHFEAAGETLALQYDAYEPLPGLHLNGHQVLSENIADVAGLATAYDAWKSSLEGTLAPEVSGKGFTADQRFFLAYAQHNRVKAREMAVRARLVSDTHAPGRFRTQTVRNIDAWYSAFNVKKGQRLFLEPAERAQIW